MTDPTTRPTLYEKLHEIAQTIEYVEKHGHNDHHHYDFVQAVDVTRVVREEMLKHRLIVLPGASNARHLAYGAKGGHLTTVDLTYKVFDIETGDSITIPWVGVGADTGGDKGIYKAYTGGFKYALIALFQIPMTSDPERDQLTAPEQESQGVVQAPAEHKDSQRPAAPVIPMDRATEILRAAIQCEMASYDLEGNPGDPPVFHPAFTALLALQGVAKIGQLNVDQAENVEAWLRNEAAAA